MIVSLKLKVIFLCSVVFVFSSYADAGVCGLALTTSNLSLSWDMNWTSQAVAITVSKSNPAACTFGLGFSKGGSSNYTRFAASGAKQLEYQVYQDSALTRVLKNVPDISSVNDVIMVTLPPGSSPQTILYYVNIPFLAATTPFLAAAGTFIDTFTINAYEGTDPLLFVNPPDASASVGVSITVPDIVAVSLVDSGGVFQDLATTKNIDFGNLFPGQVSRFEVKIRTNAGFSLTSLSTNNGRLKHAVAASFVPYKLYVNNVLSDPSGVTPVITGSGQTAMNGLGYPVKIVIGNFTGMPVTGNYSDSVLLTVTTTE
jgi:spore coat protein U-like protein